MNYKHHAPCAFVCRLAGLIKHLRWVTMSRPVSWHLNAASYNVAAIHKHFGGKY